MTAPKTPASPSNRKWAFIGVEFIRVSSFPTSLSLQLNLTQSQLNLHVLDTPDASEKNKCNILNRRLFRRTSTIQNADYDSPAALTSTTPVQNTLTHDLRMQTTLDIRHTRSLPALPPSPSGFTWQTQVLTKQAGRPADSRRYAKRQRHAERKEGGKKIKIKREAPKKTLVARCCRPLFHKWPHDNHFFYPGFN